MSIEIVRTKSFDTAAKSIRGKIYLLYIYDKSEASNVRPEAIGEMLRALGLNQ